MKSDGSDNAYPDSYTLAGPRGQSKAYTTPHTPALNASIQFVFGNPEPTFRTSTAAMSFGRTTASSTPVATAAFLRR